MTTEAKRIHDMREDIAYLRTLRGVGGTLNKEDVDKLAGVATRLDKVLTFVVQRDEGPSRDLAAENTQLVENLRAVNEKLAGANDECHQLKAKLQGRERQVEKLQGQIDELQTANLRKDATIKHMTTRMEALEGKRPGKLPRGG